MNDLSGVGFFRSLEPLLVATLVRRLTKTVVAPGETLDDERCPTRSVGIVLDGVLAITRTSRVGRQVVLGELRAGDAYGVAETLRATSPARRVVAYTHVTVGTLPHEEFHHLMERFPSFKDASTDYALMWAEELAQRLFERDALRSESRIHAELLRLAMRQGIQGNSATIRPAPTDTTLARLTGTNRAAVNRTLSALGRTGAMEKTNTGWILHDVRALEQMVSRYHDRYSRKQDAGPSLSPVISSAMGQPETEVRHAS